LVFIKLSKPLILGKSLLRPLATRLVVSVHENSLNLDNLVFVTHQRTVGEEVNVLPDRVAPLALHGLVLAAIEIGFVLTAHGILVCHLWYHLCVEYAHSQFPL